MHERWPQRHQNASMSHWGMKSEVSSWINLTKSKSKFEVSSSLYVTVSSVRLSFVIIDLSVISSMCLLWVEAVCSSVTIKGPFSILIEEHKKHTMVETLQNSLAEFQRGLSYWPQMTSTHSTANKVYLHVSSNLQGRCLLYKVASTLLAVFSKGLPQHTHSHMHYSESDA